MCAERCTQSVCANTLFIRAVYTCWEHLLDDTPLKSTGKYISFTAKPLVILHQAGCVLQIYFIVPCLLRLRGFVWSLLFIKRFQLDDETSLFRRKLLLIILRTKVRMPLQQHLTFWPLLETISPITEARGTANNLMSTKMNWRWTVYFRAEKLLLSVSEFRHGWSEEAFRICSLKRSTNHSPALSYLCLICWFTPCLPDVLFRMCQNTHFWWCWWVDGGISAIRGYQRVCRFIHLHQEQLCVRADMPLAPSLFSTDMLQGP